MNPLISIIVPVYNAEKTLARCIRSLIGQSYRNIEILLVNDGSKDASLAICRQFAQEDDRIRVIDKPNGGVSSARNAGLDAANGEFVMFCDSDDWAAEDWCRRMLENQVPNDLTVCQIAREHVAAEDPKESAAMIIAERREFLHYPMLMCSPVNKIYERAVIEENELRFPVKLNLGEDFSFVLSYVCKITGRIRFIKDELYYYDETTDGSLSKRSPTMEQCDLFYRQITGYMEILGATDRECVRNRDFLVMTQFERFLTEMAVSRKDTLLEKMKKAKEIGRLNSFASCSAEGIQWGNPLYRFFFQRKYVRLIVLFLILRAWKRREGRK